MLRGRPQHEKPPVHRFMLAEIPALLYVFIVLRLSCLVLHGQGRGMNIRSQQSQGKNRSPCALIINPLQLHPSSSSCPHLSVQHVCEGSGWENQPSHALDLVSYCESSSCRKIRAPSAHSVHRCSSCSPAQSRSVRSNHGAVPLLMDVSSTCLMLPTVNLYPPLSSWA